jgi:hypothetical protein
LLEGHFADFYEVNAFSPPDYDILMYLIFALWNLPLFLSGVTSQTVQDNPGALLYNKILPIIFLMLCCYMVFVIAKRGGASKRLSLCAAFVFLSAPAAMIMTTGMGMYDSIYVFFILLGFFFYIPDGKPSGKIPALLFFGLSFCIKPFGLFILIPVLLYSEKNILKAAAGFLISLIPLVLCKLPFLGNVPAAGSRFLHFFSASSYGMGISMFCIAYVIVCLTAYHIKPDDPSPLKYIYIAMLSILPLFVFVTWNPQWIMLFIPFFALLVSFNRQKSKFLLYSALSSIAYIAYIWTHWLQYTNGLNAFGEHSVTNSFMQQYLNLNAGAPAITSGLFPIRLELYYAAIVIAVMIFIVWKINPFKNASDYDLNGSLSVRERIYLRLHFIIPLLVFSVPVLIWMTTALT